MFEYSVKSNCTKLVLGLNILLWNSSDAMHWTPKFQSCEHKLP